MEKVFTLLPSDLLQMLSTISKKHAILRQQEKWDDLFQNVTFWNHIKSISNF